MASSTTTGSTLPKTHKTLVQEKYGEPLKVLEIPVPQPTPGSAVVKVLAAKIISYTGDIYNGSRKYPYPTPLVTGTACVGRVVAVGPDATKIEPGNLVQFDITIRGRDDPTAVILSGIFEGLAPGAKKLMQGEWRDSTYAQYAKLPLENLFLRNEKLLLGSPADGGFGYTIDDLVAISMVYVPAGGLLDINLRPGETVIIAPATGGFGGAAVHLALAMGATVIAMGRNKETLKKLKATYDRIHTVPITGDVEADAAALKKFGQADCYYDISPPEATNSTHFKSAIMALRHGGRISFMGGTHGDIPLPLSYMMHMDLTLKGKWMYDRDVVNYVDKLIDSGCLKLGRSGNLPKPEMFKLEDWEKAFKHAAEHSGAGEATIFHPE